MKPAVFGWFLIALLLAVAVQGLRGILADRRLRLEEEQIHIVYGRLQDLISSGRCVWQAPDTIGRPHATPLQ